MARPATAWATAARFVLRIQGWLYVVTGLWPVVHLASFERVTGEKYDDFLVHTVGLLLFVIGAVLLRALHGARLTADLALVAAGTAASLASIDVVFFLHGRLPPIYLLDAAAELVFLAAGIVACVGLRRPHGTFTTSRPPSPACGTHADSPVRGGFAKRLGLRLAHRPTREPESRCD